ncbi:MAG: 4Fe-4S binding protein [Chloroflexi bacterium]|nr:4Fe-4S binding protein [Chloroflexota bacterium]
MQIVKHVPEVQVPRISRRLCRACRTCEARLACDRRAILRIDQDEMPWIDASRCFGCHACIAACRFGAVGVETWAEEGDSR